VEWQWSVCRCVIGLLGLCGFVWVCVGLCGVCVGVWSLLGLMGFNVEFNNGRVY
jgi:hypothetical protein